MEKADIECTRKYVWDYFQFHASQRLTKFNFYIVISTFLTTGLFAILPKIPETPHIALILSFLLAIFSFVFWKLDERNKQLIKIAETALIEIEQKSPFGGLEGQPNRFNVFSREEFETEKIKQKNGRFFWSNYFSYSKSLRIVFFVYGILGLVGIISSAIWVYYY